MSLIVSGLIIYFVTAVLGSGKGIMTALLAALTGSVIYALSPLIPTGFLSTVIAGLVWLLAIRHFYRVGWIRALIMALVIWFVTTVVSAFLPTLAGPV
ncbi:MAG: hypothetical protein ACLFQ8_03320 [Candidatus Aenigmatarchaeota archaeon]